MKELGGDVYIGLQTTIADPSSWKWEDGTYLYNYDQWAVGEPDGNVFLNTDYCAKMNYVPVVNNVTQGPTPGEWYDVPCADENLYVCSMPVDETIGFIPPIELRCRDGYTNYYGPCFGVYAASNESIPYNDARAICETETEGLGSLAMVLDAYENAALQVALISAGVDFAWIGLSTVDDVFQWELGYPVIYLNWDSNEPSNEEGEGCVRLMADNGLWQNWVCGFSSHFVCRYDQFPLPVPPTPDPTLLYCPDDWQAYGDFCYQKSDIEASWGEGNYRCMTQFSAMLTSVSSILENQFIKSLFDDAGTEEEVWIGLARSYSSDGLWNGGFVWTDDSPVVYTPWANGEPGETSDELLEFCVSMTMGPESWNDRQCEEVHRYVCKLPKRRNDDFEGPNESCGWDLDGNYVLYEGECYLSSSITAFPVATWRDAENYCRGQGGNLASIHNNAENLEILKMSYAFFRSYWIGLNQDSITQEYKWTDNTIIDDAPHITSLSDSLDEENCAAMMIWQNGDWETSACGNSFPFICKRPLSTSFPIPELPTPTITGYCLQGYFKLGDMCYSMRGVAPEDRKSWIDARDDCRDTTLGTPLVTLATVDHPGKQAFLTSLIQLVSTEVNMWIGLNSIGVHTQFHWTDESGLDYTKWGESQPSLNNPIESPDSLICVQMMNYPEVAGMWADALCGAEMAYLCQRPAMEDAPSEPVPPGGSCPNDEYTSYGETCLTWETSTMIPYDDAVEACQAKQGQLLTVYDQYEQAFLTASLYQEDLTDGAEGWIGLKRNTDTGVFEWIDGWPLLFTMWGPDEPLNPNGDCVVVTRDGDWRVRECTDDKFYFCEDPIVEPPSVAPQPDREGCPENYIEYPDSDYCYSFVTTQKINSNDAYYFCTRDLGGAVPSLHSLAEEEFVRSEAAKVFEDDSSVWLGLLRNGQYGSSWADLTRLDYANWQTGQPTGDRSDYCVSLDLAGGWKDVACAQRLNYICKVAKNLYVPEPTGVGASFCASSALLTMLLALAALFIVIRR